jgi:ergothioneine biosynthesis protein EgtB
MASLVLQTPSSALREELLTRYHGVRATTKKLTVPLEIEDYVIAASVEASPAKWHLAHTTWFFETFILKAYSPDYVSEFQEYEVLFNSYYNAVSAQWNRADRGKLARPTVAQTFEYRTAIDEKISDLIFNSDEATLRNLRSVMELGLHHEQQHQELILTDLKALFALNPLDPIYKERKVAPPCVSPQNWRFYEGGLHEIGFGGGRFCFDNELPRHRVWLEPFVISSRLVTCGDWLEFMADGGYERHELWLSAGWNTVQSQGWNAPLYWQRDGVWQMKTLAGIRDVEAHEPVCHVSYYEADAYARWSEARLPTEAEWEVCARDEPIEGNFVEDGYYHPVAQSREFEPFGNLWQWTRSQYSPYPGYEADSGALGEYNGKFMSNQFVLRGGSCATPQSHIRATYRNFFPPEARWQFSGLRLARDA